MHDSCLIHLLVPLGIQYVGPDLPPIDAWSFLDTASGGIPMQGVSLHLLEFDVRLLGLYLLASWTT
jgi:hypothetical protein